MKRLFVSAAQPPRRSSPAPCARTGEDKGTEKGLTLVELLIVLTILPLIVGSLSLGLISVFSLRSSVSNRIVGSGDSQIVSANYVKDIQSAQLITTQASSTPQCGTGTQLLGIQWNSGQTVVSYVDETSVSGTTTTYSLVRQYCTFGNTSTPADTFVISNGLASVQSPPVISCASTVASCSASTQWIAAEGILTSKFTISEPKSNFIYTLTASPRIWSPTSGGTTGGGQPYTPVMLVDATSCNELRVGNGITNINVGSGSGNGALGVESTCPGSVTVSNGGTLNASSVITANPTLDSIKPNSNATYPKTEYYSTNFTDPFHSVAPPATPSGPSASCTSTTDKKKKATTYDCPPGVYATAPSFSSDESTSVNFSGGSYLFEQGLALPSNIVASFGSGTYIFQGSSSLATQSNVTISGSSVLFYIPGGTETLGNNNTVNLTPLSGYDGITMWNPSSGGTVQVGDNSTVTLGGGMYMPQSALTSGDNITMSTSFLVADTASFGNNMDLTVASP